MMLIALSSIFIAAVAKATADTIKHHPDTSIFINKKFWLGEGKIIPLTKYKVDGWHIANSTMIMSFLTLIFSTIPYNLFISYAVFSLEFILIFNIFYNKIFRLKDWKQ